MPNLIADNAEAAEWVRQVKKTHATNRIYEKVVSAVIWSDRTGSDGKLLVAADPEDLVDRVNNGMKLLKGHDPGLPLGRVLAAASFTSSDGMKFVAAVLGYYGGNRLSFRDLNVDTAEKVSPPASLPVLNDGGWINFGVDARNVPHDWIEDVLRSAPVPVKRTPLSHNEADSQTVLVVVGVLFVTLLFNPFTTTVASEAAKDFYKSVRKWIRNFLFELSKLEKPIVEFQSFHDGCQISFMFRDKEVRRNYLAHDALPHAAAQAAQLVKNIKSAGFDPALVVYEFHPQDDRWFPSFAELHDGQFVTDNTLLIAVEQLPKQVSLGISVGEDKPRLPSVKRDQSN